MIKNPGTVDDKLVAENAQRFTLKSETTIHRFHKSKYQADEFNNKNVGDSRFSPLVPDLSKPNNVIGTIYGGYSLDGAAAESIFHSVPTPGSGKDRSVELEDYFDYLHSVLNVRQDLDLVMLDTMGHSQLDLEPYELVRYGRSCYPETRRWALKLRQCCPWACGLVWPSRQASSELVFVLFEDRAGPLSLSKISSTPVYDDTVQDTLNDLGERWSIEVI